VRFSLPALLDLPARCFLTVSDTFVMIMTTMPTTTFKLPVLPFLLPVLAVAYALPMLPAAEPVAAVDLKLPDPLLTLGGEKVTTKEAWEKTRRAEVLELFRKNI
jgi:hypothetical protein